MPVPNSFANVTTSIPLSQLDANFNTPITIGNTAVQLGNTVTTLNNMTLANVTISSGSVTITNVSATTANVTTANVTNLISGNVALTGGSINGTTLGASNAATANVTTLTATDLTLSNSAVISVNTAGNALRITQTGAGNALLVEDSANPDSTPFVIDASGQVLIGATQAYTPVAGRFAPIEVNAVATTTDAAAFTKWSNTINSLDVNFSRSRGAIGVQTTLNSGDVISNLYFRGSDGTAFIAAAGIQVAVDGTPGTNDMPGRLVFSTTADGASSPTERMRIDSAGNVGIAATASAGVRLQVGGNGTGSTSSRGVGVFPTIQSDVTTSYQSYRSSVTTAAASFTLSELSHYATNQNAFGAGSAVTNQYGFNVAPTLTGATNNYGFYSDIASGTGRWNFYANGTAENYLGGNLKIGGTAARATTAGTNQLVLFDGTAPVGTLANGVSFYSASGEARVMDAAGNSTLLSPHDSVSNEWIFHSKHTPTGKVLRIDVEKMLRFINDHFGLDMVHEFTEGE